MTKAELIERYGIDWYEAYNNRRKKRKREHYHKNAEFREAEKTKCNAYAKARYANDDEFRMNIRLAHTRKYCRPDEFERIENYELAKADNFKGWCIHHRLELTLDGEYAHSKEELKRIDMYYNRPYYELIFLRLGEHMKLHNKARH